MCIRDSTRLLKASAIERLGPPEQLIKLGFSKVSIPQLLTISSEINLTEYTPLYWYSWVILVMFVGMTVPSPKSQVKSKFHILGVVLLNGNKKGGAIKETGVTVNANLAPVISTSNVTILSQPSTVSKESVNIPLEK